MGDPAADAVEALTPGQVAALSSALRVLADEMRTLRTLLDAHLRAEQETIDARRLAWQAIAGLAGSYPGRALGTLLALVLVAALARALGVDVEYLRALAAVPVAAVSG